MGLNGVEVFYVRIVQALKGGQYATVGEDIRFDGRDAKKSALEACEKLQAEFDEDADPKRVYVLDSHRIAIRAGAQRYGRGSG